MGRLLVRWMQDSTLDQAIKAHEAKSDRSPAEKQDLSDLVGERQRRNYQRHSQQRRLLTRLGWAGAGDNTSGTKDIA